MTSFSHRTKGALIMIVGVFALFMLLSVALNGRGPAGALGTKQVSLRSVGNTVGSGAIGWATPEMAGADMDFAVARDEGIARMPAPAPTTAPGMPGIRPPMDPSAGPTAADAEQRIIKNGNLDLVVGSVQDGIADITRLASGRGGFVQHSSVQERGNGTFSGSITVRVPAPAFEAAMTDIKELATLVRSESTSGQDVTEQYTDLEARLRNARAQETTYLALLNRATSVEDILAVQRELSNIRYQIESLEGQRQYLENQTALSTISVSLAEEPSVRLPTRDFRPVAAAREAVQALVNALQGMVIGLIYFVIIGIGTLIPTLIIGAILWWIGAAAWRAFTGGPRRD